ncbi:ADP-ribosylglycohydrolase family protein [Cellulosilyticum sp. I15G10I2]|uniref:ADP-ribosylglycohydrolase family protein n=1 Tax=Cellulosilyticum sp. I15G10I2 TaxID=1892843 RepID=UPI00085CA57A|nr:ADP-ribosylglycohydrolase family protein [Cellulosilyticum sp. I15G10I2]
MKRRAEHFYGCLAGGAIGDALGAPIEFMSYDKILEKYGENGLSNLLFAPDTNYAKITDDTQMTLFTAEGIIRSATKAKKNQAQRTTTETTAAIFRAYLRWLYTQGLKTPYWMPSAYDGWLIRIKTLHAYRDPGVTCITTLGKGIMGTIKKPINDSKGCGGMMRVAPIGLVEDEKTVFELGMHAAAITHGHPTGYVAAGILAAIIHYIIEGEELLEAIHKALIMAKQNENAEECIALTKKAIALAKEGNPCYEKLKMLGQGFVAEETLAIAIYAVLSYPNDLKQALLLAVNHDGDSDSTGAVAGNILGAYLGAHHIDEELLNSIELSKEIKELSHDLFVLFEESERWMCKYPAW